MSQQPEVTAEVEIAEEIAVVESLPNLTPYAACKVANKILATAGIERELKPQMFYSYASKNTIATVPDSKPVLFVGDEFKIWLDAYIAKAMNGESGSQTNFDALAEKFM